MLATGKIQVSTWPSYNFWNACWRHWHCTNVPGMYFNNENRISFSSTGAFLFDHGSFFIFFHLSNQPCFSFCLSQVARAILENPKDKTNVRLIYANVTYEDILLKVDISPSLKCICSQSKHCNISPILRTWLQKNQEDEKVILSCVLGSLYHFVHNTATVAWIRFSFSFFFPCNLIYSAFLSKK